MKRCHNVRIVEHGDVPQKKRKGGGSSSSGRVSTFAETGQAKGRYSIEVLSRAIDILCAFDHARPFMSLAEIVHAVRLPKTTVFRVLSSLAARRFCQWDAQAGKYSLGFELLRLADNRRLSLPQITSGRTDGAVLRAQAAPRCAPNSEPPLRLGASLPKDRCVRTAL